MIADMKVKANLIQVFAPVFFLPVVVIDLGQDSESRCESEWSGWSEQRVADNLTFSPRDVYIH